MIDNSGTRHARGGLIAARERLRAGSKQMATYEAIVQTQSRYLIAARECPRAGSKQIATYQAVAQTKSSSSSTRHTRGCLIAARERLRAGSEQMATCQAVVQTQSRCLIAAREPPRAGGKQMATYQAVAQTQSSSSSSNLCCSVATQTWSAHVARSLLHTIHYASMNCCCMAHTYTA